MGYQTAKINKALIADALKTMRENTKPRKFTQSVELQLALKDYDPQKDKRFVGTVRLPNLPRPNLKICIIADEKHKTEAKEQGIDIDVTDLDTLKKFNKDKKLVKKWAKQYSLLIASDTVLKKIPVVVGPILNRIQMFPTMVNKNSPLILQVQDIRGSVKFQLRKVTNMGCCAGREDMTDEQLVTNLMMCLNFLVSLLKKGW
jgi:large subunit ribosomal protein L10Ae